MPGVPQPVVMPASFSAFTYSNAQEDEATSVKAVGSFHCGPIVRDNDNLRVLRKLLEDFGESFDVFDRTIDSHIKNLRAKLGARPDGGAYVETVRGVGYRAARSAEPS